MLFFLHTDRLLEPVHPDDIFDMIVSSLEIKGNITMRSYLVDYSPCFFLHTDQVDKPVHPVDVFDMIVGTSTGKCLLI